MLDAYISKEDIIKLLDETEALNGMIKKKEFQIALNLLKSHRKPQPQKTTDRINNVRYIIANITKYQNDIVSNKIRSNIMNRAISGIGNNIHSILYIKIYIDRRTGSAEKGKDAIDSTKELSLILGVSVPTIHKWMKKNIIIRHIPNEVWYYIGANKEVRGRIYVPYYYDLEEVKNNLMRYK